MIAGSAFESTKLAGCDDSQMTLFFGLVVKADDEGMNPGDTLTLKLKFPNRRWSENKIRQMMEHLTHAKLINWYECACGTVYEVIDFEDWQQGSWMGVHKVDSKHTHFKAEHCNQCTGALTPVRNCTNTVAKISKDKISKEKRREVPPHIEGLIHKANEIPGWLFTFDQDADYFTRLLDAFPQLLIEKTIEDLRVYQEKPAKKYTNLHATLRNWCKRALPEDEPHKSDVPLDPDGNAMVRTPDGYLPTKTATDQGYRPDGTGLWRKGEK